MFELPLPVATYRSPCWRDDGPVRLPDRPLALGRDLVALERADPGDREVDDVAVVLAAVTVEAPEGDVEPPVRRG